MQHHRNLAIPDNLADVCDPDRLALVVFDMQVGVVGQLADGPQVTDRVKRVLEAARRSGVRVFFTRHMSLPTELMGSFQLRMAMVWQRKERVEDVVSPFLRDSPSFELVPELAPLASETIFDELSMSAFEGTPLEFALRDTGVTAFAIVGVAIEVGIEPTVRHGADRGLIPVVVTDACGAGTMLPPSGPSTPSPPRGTRSSPTSPLSPAFSPTPRRESPEREDRSPTRRSLDDCHPRHRSSRIR